MKDVLGSDMLAIKLFSSINDILSNGVTNSEQSCRRKTVFANNINARMAIVMVQKPRIYFLKKSMKEIT